MPPAAAPGAGPLFNPAGAPAFGEIAAGGGSVGIPQFSPGGLLPFSQGLAPPALLWMLHLQQIQHLQRQQQQQQLQQLQLQQQQQHTEAQQQQQHTEAQQAVQSLRAFEAVSSPLTAGIPGTPATAVGTPAMPAVENSLERAAGGPPAAKANNPPAAKRPRLVWTKALHQRFVEAVEKLGERKAVPKSIMQHMGVEGLTRENVASHLQKYRQYIKRQRGELKGANSGEEKAKDAKEASAETALATATIAPAGGPGGAQKERVVLE